MITREKELHINMSTQAYRDEAGNNIMCSTFVVGYYNVFSNKILLTLSDHSIDNLSIPITHDSEEFTTIPIKINLPITDKRIRRLMDSGVRYMLYGDRVSTYQHFDSLVEDFLNTNGLHKCYVTISDI